jgi:hypothetical protein
MEGVTAMNKEEVYDAQINPLMAQIINICQEHKIAMLACFALPIPEDVGLMCTTALLGADHEPPQILVDALDLVGPNALGDAN